MTCLKRHLQKVFGSLLDTVLYLQLSVQYLQLRAVGDELSYLVRPGEGHALDPRETWAQADRYQYRLGRCQTLSEG